MKRRAITLCLLLPALGAPVRPADQGAFPLQDESLHYTVNWPSGLSLGEATLTAHRTAGEWDFELTLDAGVPGLRIADRFHSVTRPDLCSVQLNRDISQGARKSSEKTVFDYQNGVAQRTSLNGGGTSEVPMATHCAYDALAFLYEARRVLGQGSVPPPHQVYLGPAYSIGLEYTGQQTIAVAGKPAVSDHVAVSVKGPASSSNFEIFFARDAARTPLVARIPSSLGTISLELSR
jgi:Protein of unknown function (DUF3108)